MCHYNLRQFGLLQIATKCYQCAIGSYNNTRQGLSQFTIAHTSSANVRLQRGPGDVCFRIVAVQSRLQPFQDAKISCYLSSVTIKDSDFSTKKTTFLSNFESRIWFFANRNLIMCTPLWFSKFIFFLFIFFL